MRYLIVLFILLVGCSAPPFVVEEMEFGGLETITFDAAAQTSHSGEPAEATWNHVMGSGTNGIVIVCASGLSTPNAPTYDGNAMTSIDSQDQTSCHYYLTSTAETVEVKITGGNIKVGGSMSFFGVDQSDPIGASAKEDGSASPNDMTLTTEEDGSMRIDVHGGNRDDTISVTASLDDGTVRFNDEVPQNQFRIALFGYSNPQASAGADTYQWTTDAATRDYLVFELKAATEEDSCFHSGGDWYISDECWIDTSTITQGTIYIVDGGTLHCIDGATIEATQIQGKAGQTITGTTGCKLELWTPD